MPLVAKIVLSMDEEDVPATLRAASHSAATSQATTALRQLQLVERFGVAMDRAGIAWLMMKGLALSERAYGDALLKAGIDIDVLVSQEALPEAFAVLRSMQLSPIFPRDTSDLQLFQWHKGAKESVWSGDGLQIDLHHALADREGLLSVESGLPPWETVMLTKAAEVRALRPDWLLAHLSIHGASSAWFRWKWLVDMAALVHRLGNGRSKALAEAARLAPQREWNLALSLIARWFPDTGIEEPRLDARTALARELCESFLVGRLSTSEPTELRLGTVPIHLATIALAPSATAETGRILRRARLNR